VVDLAGLTTAPAFPGESLARFWTDDGGAAPHRPMLLSEVRRSPGNPDWFPVSKGDMHSVQQGDARLIRNGDGREELYDLAVDPLEQRDLAGGAQATGVMDRLRRGLTSILAGEVEGQ
jgi:hypothetical protein